MTDNEIIKALECCGKPVNEECCSECPYYLGGQENCHKLLGDIIDLINRQQAEIERLSNFVTEERCIEIAREMIPAIVKQAKSEAYKEFAERLKESKKQYEGTLAGMTFTMTELDNLVKEMVGETDD